MTIINIKNRLHEPAIRSVFTLSMYLPTPEKLALRAAAYQADPDVSVFACFDKEKPLGTIVLTNHGAQSFEIMSIAVIPNCRNQGIGSKLITYAAQSLHCAQITAETDNDAIGFYRRCGFVITSLGEKYPKCIRYLCKLNYRKSDETL
ncbi:MAG TPA: GNAT family N-acetyltransferase [Oscillospiraceae bacterium]|nr:GNAT family N-acetyltransferase [Oscillospiraceae bacterium]HPS34886.1 GNAT family N-acetyltransferase [Oscillospiraceae bacterium]